MATLTVDFIISLDSYGAAEYLAWIGEDLAWIGEDEEQAHVALMGATTYRSGRLGPTALWPIPAWP